MGQHVQALSPAHEAPLGSQPKASSGQTVGKGQNYQDHTQHLAFAPE